MKRRELALLALLGATILAATVYYPPATYTYDGANYYQTDTSGTGPIGIWECENNFTDWTGQGHDIGHSASVAFPSVAGQIGNYCAGPLGSQYLDLSTTSALWNGAPALTICISFQYTASSGSDLYAYSAITGAGIWEWHLIVEGGTGKLKIRDTSYVGGNAYIVGPVLTVGNWYRVIISYDTSTGTNVLNVNGTSYTATPFAGAALNPSGSQRIGAAYNGANQTGFYYDDIRIYKRLLNTTEQAAYMAGTLDAAVSPPPTNTFTLTQTPTLTPYLTPTPYLTVTPCGAPFPASIWTFYAGGTPIIVPTTTPDNGAVYEPSAVWWNNQMLMVHSAGYSVPFTEMRTSPDGLTNWSGPTKILGNGVGNEPDVVGRAKIGVVNSSLVIYYADFTTGNMNRATTPDNGVTWSFQNIAAHTVADMASGIQNIGFIQDPVTGYVRALLEANSTSNGHWCLYPYISTDGGVTFNPMGGKPLVTLGATGNSCARTIFQDSVTHYYHIWYHQSDKIYHAVSADFFNWIPDSTWTKNYTGTMFGLAACSQAVDACMVDTGHGLILYFDGTDNTHQTAKIGALTLNTTLQNYFGCSIATPIPTPTPSNGSWTRRLR